MPPWSDTDAKKHKHNLSKPQSRKWAKIANAVLSDSDDEGKAIRIANSNTKKSKSESGPVLDRLGRLLETDSYPDNGGGDFRHTVEEPDQEKINGIRLIINGKDYGDFQQLGRVVAVLMRKIPDLRTPIDWISDEGFTSGDDDVSIFYSGSKGKIPLDDEDKEDIESLIVAEQDSRRAEENEDFEASPDNDEAAGQEDNEEDAGSGAVDYESGSDE